MPAIFTSLSIAPYQPSADKPWLPAGAVPLPPTWPRDFLLIVEAALAMSPAALVDSLLNETLNLPAPPAPH